MWNDIDPVVRPPNTEVPGSLPIEKGCWIRLHNDSANKTYICKFCGTEKTCGVSRAKGHFTVRGEMGWKICPATSAPAMAAKEYFEELLTSLVRRDVGGGGEDKANAKKRRRLSTSSMSTATGSSRFLKSSKTVSSIGDVVVREHVFSFPLDWQDAVDMASDAALDITEDSPPTLPNTQTIDVFVRELSSSTATSSDPAVLFLQGGPGFPSPRPTTPPSGWMKVALSKGYRVLLLDQRGTGSSTAMSVQRLMHLEKEGGIELQAHFLSNMRSDAIADDIDAIRHALCGAKGKISLLGQSFGGFCMLSYLSRYASNMDKGFFTCGLAPITRSIQEVYTATYRRMLVRNRRFYRRYPQDIQRVKGIIAHLHIRESSSSPVLLPRGGFLTVRRFLQLGHMLGAGSGIDSLHNLLEDAWFVEESEEDGLGTGGVLSASFLHAVEEEQYSFEYSPIYWLMHESIYMSKDGSPSAWTAEKVLSQPEFKDVFDPLQALASKDQDTYVNFTGEMVYSWMGEDYAALRPLREVASVLAEKVWDRPLYDLKVLKDCAKKVPCAALVSYDDVYVERFFSEETSELLGGEDYCKLWVTNEFQHSGLRDDPARVMETLFKIIHCEMKVPS